MAGTTLEATSPRPMIATVRAQATTPTQQGIFTADLFAFSAAIAQGKSKDDVIQEIIDQRVQRERALSGRSLSEPVNKLEELVVPFLKMAEDVAPSVLTFAGVLAGTGVSPGPGTVVGGVGGAQLGDIVKDGLGAVNGVTSYVMTFPPVADYLKGVRAKSGAVAIAEYAQDAELLDSAAAMAWSAIRGNPQAAAAFQVLFPDVAGVRVGEDFTATAGDVVRNHPDLFDVTHVTVRPDNSVLIKEVKDARADILAKLDGLSTTVKEGLATTATGLGTLQEQQNQLAEGQAGLRKLLEKARDDAKARAEAEKKAREDAEFVKALYDGAQGTISGISALATLLGDPKLGRDIAQFGGATLQTVAAAHKVVESVGAIVSKGLGVVTGLGMAAATGNILGAIVSLLGLFGPSGPTPEQQILEGIQRLEQAIADLHKAVQTGLKRIDEKLDRMYEDISGDLTDLARKADLTLHDLADIRTRVARNQETLDEITTSMSAYFAAEQRRDLHQTLYAALGYRNRNSKNMTQAEFNTYASHLYTWATDTCFNATSQPLPHAAVKLEHLPVRLRSGDRADHASFVNQALHDLGIGQFTTRNGSAGRAPLPNILIWYIAARAYLQLQGEWPALADPTDDRRDDIAAAGERYRAALAAKAADRTFFDKVADLYLDAAEGFGAAIDGLREHFQVNELAGQLGHVDGTGRGVRCDLFGHVDQPIHHDWALPRVMRSDFGGRELPVPDGLKKFLPPSLAWVAWLRSDIELRYGINTSPTTSREVIGGNGGGGPFIKPKPIVVKGTKYDFVVYATAGGRRLEAAIPGPTYLRAGGHNLSRDLAVEAWEQHILPGWQQTIERASVGNPPPPDAAVTEAVEEGLRHARIRFRDYVIQQTAPNGRLSAAVTGLDGAAALVEAVTALVAPVPRANDDILRAFFDGPPVDAGGLALFAPGTPEALARTLPGPDIPHGSGKAGHGAWLVEQIAPLPAYYKERMAAWTAQVTAGTIVATFPEVDDALLRLRAAAPLLTLLDGTRKVAAALTSRPAPGPGPRPQVEYVVVRGDTLHKIAKKFKVEGGWQAIAAANKNVIKKPPNIVPGMRLKIPSAGTVPKARTPEQPASLHTPDRSER